MACSPDFVQYIIDQCSGAGTLFSLKDDSRIPAGEAGARNDRKSLTGAPGAEGRVLQWSCYKWSSKGRGSAPEDGTKASERSFSGANWL